MTNQDQYATEGVAIVGMAGCFPGAQSIQELWDNLVAGVESIKPLGLNELDPCVSEELKANPHYVPARAIIKDVDKFDARFFNLSPLEATVMDPQQRVFCQVAWSALEDAGCVPDTFDGLIGVFAGAGPNTYFAHHVSPNLNIMSRIGDYAAQLLNEKDYLATRVSYSFNLRGPSISVNTACSTSLVAVFEAYSHLMTFQCDAAIAGGVGITTPQEQGYLWHQGAIFSRTGHCRPFSSDADGIVPGSGAGAVVLKRLEDALAARDRIYAVIRGIGLNNDGSRKIGFTAPSIEGQRGAVAMALGIAGVDPATIGYIEAHGTGTALGDPIEVRALREVFGDSDKKSCALGSIKSNIGHLDVASGVSGLIKAALVLYHKQIPPTLHFAGANTELDLDKSPFFVNKNVIPLSDGPQPRRVGVSSLGLGGTNVHVVLEEAAPVTPPAPPSGEHFVFPLAAKDKDALKRCYLNLADYLQRHPETPLVDIAHTLQTGRTTFDYRGCIVADCQKNLVVALQEAAAESAARPVQGWCSDSLVFMFPGQGAQFATMGATMYKNAPVYRATVDTCAEILKKHMKRDIRDLIFADGDSSELNETKNTQPALFVVEYALARQWIAWGFTPSAMAGHSIGEWVAACLAGVFSLEDALYLVVKRGELIQSMPRGAMLSVGLPEEDCQKNLIDGVNLAAANAPDVCVVSGDFAAIDALKAKLEKSGVTCRNVQTSHGFHSPMMAAAADEFRALFGNIKLNPPQIPIVSTATGTWIKLEQITDPDYWSNQIKLPVRFAAAVANLVQKPRIILLEVGPGRTLSSLAQRQMRDRHAQLTVSSGLEKNKNESAAILQTIGKLWTNGVKVNWQLLGAAATGRKISLPSYPFQKDSYWLPAVRVDFQSAGTHTAAIENQYHEVEAKSESQVAGGDMSPIESFLAQIWRDQLGLDHVAGDSNFFDVGGHSLIGVALLEKLQKHYGVQLALATLIQHPTVRKLADHIQSQLSNASSEGDKAGSGNDWTPLVAMKTGGSRLPLYCVSGLGGTVMELMHVAKFIADDIPFYGFETRGVAGHVPHETVAQMAAENIKAIRGIQPHGPYCLSGYSSGGTVAYEMAQQLTAADEQVALLAFIDSDSPTLPYRNASQLRKVKLKRFLRHPISYLGEMIRRQCAKRSHGRLSMYKSIETVTERAIKHYRPVPYKGDAVLFQTYKNDYIGDIRWIVDEYNGWKELIQGDINVHPLPGVHLTVCQHPENATVLADLFNRIVREITQTKLSGGIPNVWNLRNTRSFHG